MIADINKFVACLLSQGFNLTKLLN